METDISPDLAPPQFWSVTSLSWIQIPGLYHVVGRNVGAIKQTHHLIAMLRVENFYSHYDPSLSYPTDALVSKIWIFWIWNLNLQRRSYNRVPINVG